MHHPGLTRRSLLRTAALGTAATIAGGGAAAAGEDAGFYRFTVGTCRITALSDGVWHRPMGDAFVHNASPAAVQAAMRAASLPLAPTLPLAITALMVETGSKLVLIDTGSAGQVVDTAGTLPRHLAAAGFDPARVDVVLISHFHPDHIDGLRAKYGAPVFANAQISVPEAEWRFWMDDATLNGRKTVHHYALNARRIFGDMTRQVERFAPEAAVAPGITAIAAPGHTPGHSAFLIASGRDTLLVLGDTVSHPALFLKHPRWKPGWDMDGEIAVATRLQLLSQAASDGLLVAGYHFPFPACGRVLRDGKDFAWVPV